MNNTKTGTMSTKTIAGLGLLTAIVIVLQLLASYIHFGPFSITLALVPIIVGAALYGKIAGLWLGFVFSIIVLIMDSAAFMTVNIPGTVITVILKGTLAGLASACVYHAINKKTQKTLPSVIVAAIVAPIVNTGIFIVGCFIFFYPTIAEWAGAEGYNNPVAYLLLGMIGINFIIELLVNLILSTTIVQIIKYAKKSGSN